ncbi:MAG: dual specificity protein phosphatase family protein [Hyphomicrobiaceae bacterium]|nr:dual specificity protein phosphatase family protein [Hyphomicrobiaceae bacterium]
MMNPAIYWVDAPLRGRLAVVSRPRSPAHFGALKAGGIDVLVSMLEPDEAESVGLADEARHCAEVGIEFMHLPITDHGVPTSFTSMEQALVAIAGHLEQGRGVGAHCFAGLGRSPLLVAAVLIHHGHTDETAVELVSEARGTSVPEMDEQYAWLLELALRQTGRTGQ